MTRKVIRGLFVLAGLLAVIGLAYLYALLTGGFEVPRLAKLSNCESRLRILATAIYGLGEEHYYIPRDGRSEFTPNLYQFHTRLACLNYRMQKLILYL